MSWDVSLYRFSRRYESIEEIPGNEQPAALGSLLDIHAAVLAVFPETDWRDPVWGIYKCDIGSIEFNVGKRDPVQSLGLHVRAEASIVDGILDLCDHLSCQAIDLTDGRFLDRAANPVGGLQKWRAYRDQVVGRSGKT